MPPFLTEKQTEAWLEMETRDLPMPDGSLRAFTDTKLLWNAYDFIQVREMLTAARMVELAMVERDRTALPFEITFPHIVSYAYSELRKRLGIDDPD